MLKRKADLVRLLVFEGVDVQHRNFVGMPVLSTANAVGASPKVKRCSLHTAPQNSISNYD